MSRKLASAALAVSTTVWLLTPAMPVFAQSVQDQINALLAQIAALQAQLAAVQNQPVGAGVGALTKNLKLGSSDPEVRVLQEGLKKDAAVYPEGLVTGYFGPLTQKAVVRFQEKYASEVLAPSGLTSGTGFVGAATRAKFNALYAGVVPGVSPMPGVTPVPVGGGLVVSLESMSGGTVVADSTSGDGAQALAEVLKLRFTGSGRITQLRLHRIGISADSDFSNVYLYDGGVKVAEAPAVASGYFTFTNAAGIFDVNGSKVLTLKVDLANGASSGKTFQFGVMAASDVVSNAVTVSGAFPFHGAEWRTATVSDLGKLTATSTAPTADATVDAGSKDYEVWKLNLTAADQAIDVKYLRFTMVGTADYDAVQNLKLYVDGVQVGSAVLMMSTDKSVAFDFMGSPIEVKSGVTKNLSLRGDIVKGSGRNFYFRIQNSSDIQAWDKGYGVAVKVNQADVWSIVKPPTDVEITVNSGSLSVQKAASSPTGPLADGATNLELARFEFKAVGEDVKLSQVSISWDEGEVFKNLKLTLDGVQIGTTQSTATSGAAYAFNPGSSFVVPAGVTKVLTVWADLTDANFGAGDTFQIDLDAGSGNALRMSSGSTFNAPNSEVSGNTIAVTSGTLTVTKNASVANLSTVKGANGIVIASWLITAPSDQAVNMTSLAVNNSGASSGTSTPGLGAAFDVLTLWSGGVQVGQTINSPSSATGTAQTFSFASAMNIPAGQSKQFDLKANVLTNADTAWNAGVGDVVALTSVNTTGVITNSAINYSTETLGQTINIAAAAGVTIDKETAPTMPDSQYFVAGDTGVTLAAYKFTVDNTEDVRVNRIQLREVGSPDKPGNLRNIKLYVDGVQKGATIPAFLDDTVNTALFEDTALGLFDIPKNTSKSIVVKADVTPNTDASFVASGTEQVLRIAVGDITATSTSNVSAKGVTSGAFVAFTNSCASNQCDSNAVKVVKTKPTFALVAPASTTLIPGEMEILRFRITAHSAEDILFTSGTHNIRLTQTSAGTGGAAATAYNFKLYDAATNVQVGETLGVVTSTYSASGGTINFTFSNATTAVATYTVAKGTTKEYYVKANLTNWPTTGMSFKVDILNDGDDFSWSDNTSSADVNNDNFIGQGLPLFGPTFVKP